MKKKLITAMVAAGLGLASFGASAEAAPADRACFGQIHKIINTEGALGFDKVGDVVKAIGGQMKNETARGLCS